MARSAASCGPGPAVAGSSELPNLVINGQAVTVTGAPNQTVSLPNGTATINEKTSAVAGSSGELRVVALHDHDRRRHPTGTRRRHARHHRRDDRLPAGLASEWELRDRGWKYRRKQP